MKKKYMLLLSFIILGLAFSIVAVNPVHAATVSYDFIKGAKNWFDTSPTNNLSMLDPNLMKSISSLIETIGTGVIAVVTVVLGLKYVTSGATGKADVKQQLTALVVSCIMLYGWSSLSPLLIKNATYNATTGTYDTTARAQLFIFAGVDTPEAVVARIFAIVLLVAKLAAIVTLMIIGVKYIYGGAKEKSAIKEKAPVYIIGLLMVFCTLNFLTMISDAINAALQ